MEDFDTVFDSYLRKPTGFAIDGMAALPIDIFALVVPVHSQYMLLSCLRIIHLIRLYRVFEFFGKWETELNIK